MHTDATMLIAGLTSLFAVSLLFLSLFVSGENGSGSKTRAVFKTGNPSFKGKPASQGLEPGEVEVPETIESARKP